MYNATVLNNQRRTRLLRVLLLALTTLTMATTALAAAPIGQIIWIKSAATGLYVSADLNRGSFAPLVADRASVGGWEQFQIVDAGGGFIALRAVSSGRYVSADTNRANVPLVADRATFGAWEQFQWIDNAAGQVQLRAVNVNRYVSADLNLGAWAPLVANRTAPSGWETFFWGIVGSTTPPGANPDFGPNVAIFDPSMSIATIQTQINNVYSVQRTNHFGPQRNALIFKPGVYSGLDIPVGFYTQILGVGASPDNVSITGNLHSDAFLSGDNATQNFWRGAEGFAITPSSGVMQWAVSQAVPFRRMHVRGGMKLNQNNGWSSGGWMY